MIRQSGQTAWPFRREQTQPIKSLSIENTVMWNWIHIARSLLQRQCCQRNMESWLLCVAKTARVCVCVRKTEVSVAPRRVLQLRLCVCVCDHVRQIQTSHASSRCGPDPPLLLLIKHSSSLSLSPAFLGLCVKRRQLLGDAASSSRRLLLRADAFGDG